VRGHGLGVFERAARLEVSRDARRAEHVAAELDLEAGLRMVRRRTMRRRSIGLSVRTPVLPTWSSSLNEYLAALSKSTAERLKILKKLAVNGRAISCTTSPGH
jgi:hypothetical protein